MEEGWAVLLNLFSTTTNFWKTVSCPAEGGQKGEEKWVGVAVGGGGINKSDDLLKTVVIHNLCFFS